MVYIESIRRGDGLAYVGLTEIENASPLDTPMLVEVAKELSESVLAVQLISPNGVAGAIHLLSAAQNALNAWNGGYAIARSLDVELILYASAQSQIGRAFDMLGLHDTPKTVAVVVIAEHEPDVHSLLDVLFTKIGPEVSNPLSVDQDRMKHIMELFEIGEPEISALSADDSAEARIEALGRCVASRVSILAVDS